MFLIKLFKALNRSNVKYALVGGYAVALHGAVRGTIDLDIAISLDANTFIKVEAILQKLGLESRLPVKGKDVFIYRKDYIQNRNLIAWSFYDPKTPSHLVDVIITEDASRIETLNIEIDHVRVAVATIRELIKMKKKSGRAQDIADIKALEELKKASHGNS